MRVNLNLKIWYRWSYLQSINNETGVENKRVDTKGEGGGMNWKTGIDVQVCAGWLSCV